MSESESSECDWEEVTDKILTENATGESETSVYNFPSEGIKITLEGKNFKNHHTGRKGLDPAGIIRRELNRQKRELQIDLHKVSLLCLLAQGLAFNKVLRDERLFDLASSSLQSKKSTNLPKHIDLGYMEKFVRWFRATFVTDPELVLVDDNKGEKAILTVNTIMQCLCIQLQECKVANNNYLAFLFVLILRSMGIQARWIWSLQPIPLKPSPEELLKAPPKCTNSSNINYESSVIQSGSAPLKEQPSDSSSLDHNSSMECRPSKGKKNKKSGSDTKAEFSVNTKKKDRNSKLTQAMKYIKTKESSNSPSSRMKRVLRSDSKIKLELNVNNNSKHSELDQSADSEQDSVGSESTDSDFEPTPPKKLNKTKGPIFQSRGSTKSNTGIINTSRKMVISESETNQVNIKKVIKKADLMQSGTLEVKNESSEDTDSDFIQANKKSRRNKSTGSKSISTSRTSPKADSTPNRRPRRVVIPISTKLEKNSCDMWAEVYLEEEERWISVDLTDCTFLCDTSFERKVSQPLCYILAFGNLGQVKDVTRRYASQWLTITQKHRADSVWWNASIRRYRGRLTAKDKDEEEFLDQQVLSQPFPKSLHEFKNHPLFVLRRHLLKFEAIYPEEPIPVGFIKNEPFFLREYVKILHSREPWLKKAKVVRTGETPYKIVKSRPKYDQISRQIIKDQPLELFGEWQVEDYIPPTAKDGKVPRNEYGNVNLFLDKMLPKGTVHIQVAGLQRLARKLDIDCAPAVVGFDFHSGGCHPTFQGFVVCEEYKDILLDAWSQEQDEIMKKEEEKRLSRIYGNWRRLIKGVLLRERLESKYAFSLGGKLKSSSGSGECNAKPSTSTSEEPDVPSRKRRRRQT